VVPQCAVPPTSAWEYMMRYGAPESRASRWPVRSPVLKRVQSMQAVCSCPCIPDVALHNAWHFKPTS